MPTTKTTTTKTTAAKKPRAPRAKKAEVEAPKEKHEEQAAVVAQQPEAIISEKPTIAHGKYVFATGRRKSAVANVRMFSGKGETTINKKPLNTYFSYKSYAEEALRPFAVTGMTSDFYGVITVNGGGAHAQAQAIRHGFSQALGKLSEEVRKVLKKNGFLTRDPREKERKKPGLKRARRSPQWAKR
jgi:small subunit ribosomal protein S9